MKIISSTSKTNGSSSALQTAPVIGELISVDAQGQAWVDYAGNSDGKVLAQSLISLPPSEAVEGLRVMLQFENHQADKPIIMGVVHSQLVNNEVKTLTLNSDLVNAALVDGKKIQIDARDEIELKCGKSSILMRKDGKIVLKGMELTSRALKTNKIKGGSVSIN